MLKLYRHDLFPLPDQALRRKMMVRDRASPGSPERVNHDPEHHLQRIDSFHSHLGGGGSAHGRFDPGQGKPTPVRFFALSDVASLVSCAHFT